MSDKENEEIHQVDEAFGELLALIVLKHPCLYDKECEEYNDEKFVTDTWMSILKACNTSVDEVKKQWKNLSKKLLPLIVRKHPCLYDENCKEYKNNEFVTNTWVSIAKACNMPVNKVCKQWEYLSDQFTKVNKSLAKMNESSGTGNDTKKPWYLYQSLLFLESSNLVQESTMSTQSSPSTSQSAPQPVAQSASGSSFNLCTPDLFSDDLNVLISLPERSASSASSVSSVSSVSQPKSLTIARKDLLSPPSDQSTTRKIKESRKEQEQLSKMIGNMTEAINILVHNLSEKRSQSVSGDNGEEAAMAETLIYALINSKYKIQSYKECLSVSDKFRNVTAVETVQNL